MRKKMIFPNFCSFWCNLLGLVSLEGNCSGWQREQIKTRMEDWVSTEQYQITKHIILSFCFPIDMKEWMEMLRDEKKRTMDSALLYKPLQVSISFEIFYSSSVGHCWSPLQLLSSNTCDSHLICLASNSSSSV